MVSMVIGFYTSFSMIPSSHIKSGSNPQFSQYGSLSASIDPQFRQVFISIHLLIISFIDKLWPGAWLVPVFLKFHSVVYASCCTVTVRVAAVEALLCHHYHLLNFIRSVLRPIPGLHPGCRLHSICHHHVIVIHISAWGRHIPSFRQFSHSHKSPFQSNSAPQL